jgi:hypothetical protein
MEAINKIAARIQGLELKEFKKYLLFFLGCMIFVFGSITYYIYQEKNNLINRIKQLQTLTEKSYRIIADNRRMAKEELRLKEALDRNKDFTLRGFFEQFCREQNIIAESGWDARSEAVNEKFDEITLPATFKGLTTDKLVSILEILDKNELVYIKELLIRNEGEKKIGFDIKLATKKYKSFVD